MKVRIRISTTRQELESILNDEKVATITENFNIMNVYETISGKTTKCALLGEIYKQSDNGYENLSSGILPIELAGKNNFLMAVIEREIDENKYIIFKRTAFRSELMKTPEKELIEGIKNNKILDLKNNDDNYKCIILTDLKREEIIGALVI